MHISVNDFEDYAKEFLGCVNSPECVMLKCDKCWDICFRTWLNGILDANGWAGAHFLLNELRSHDQT